MIFFEKNKVLGVEPNRVLNIHCRPIRRNLKNKHDLKRARVKKGVRPCTCLCIDTDSTYHVYIYVDSDKADLWVDVDSKQIYRYMYIYEIKACATNKYINVPFCKKLTRISNKSSSVDFTAFTILSTNILDIDLYQNKERKTLHPVSNLILASEKHTESEPSHLFITTLVNCLLGTALGSFTRK